MASLTYLHQKITNKRQQDQSYYRDCPDFIKNNLSQSFELRGYQFEAISNFITYFDDLELRTKPTQVLFQMATGSGKTIVMASLIIFLYSKGYRHFIFCVNSTTIINKTVDNFIDHTSSKYLFRYDNELEINGKRIKIKSVRQFSDTDDVQILFSTVQKLHSDLNAVKENSISYEDFGSGVVIISDEAHHLNVDTKNKVQKEDNRSWESTVNAILNQSNSNILLEFTATAGLKNEAIRNAYIGKLIYDYPLENFYRNGFSKEIKSLRSDLSMDDRILQAVIINQFRLILFNDHRISVKPVILFKANKTNLNKENFERFQELIKSLTVEDLRRILLNSKSEICKQINSYLLMHSIDFSTLLYEIQVGFAPEHCLITDTANKITPLTNEILNSLEDHDNPYRAIFAVDQLNEGWDVLNLFDIVRTYDTRQDGGKNQDYTIKEAQLIGRGARYCPFRVNDTDPKFQRKYDSDENNIMRLCETLFYHCYNEERYISELKKALKTTGLEMDIETNIFDYKIKDSFKKTDLYRSGVVFTNKRKEKCKATIDSIDQKLKDDLYSYSAISGFSTTDSIMTEDEVKKSKIGEQNIKKIKFSEIVKDSYPIIHKACRQFKSLEFSNILRHYPNLGSLKEFLSSSKYLGDITIRINYYSGFNLNEYIYKALIKTLNIVSTHLSSEISEYEGSKEFYPYKIKDIFTDKTISLSKIAQQGGRGVSQCDSSTDDLQMDLSAHDWYIYNDNYGTNEEKALVKEIYSYMDKLKDKYSKVFLLRNEQQYSIYSFNGGNKFEPDFLLFLINDNKDVYEQIQVFIEPKGENLLSTNNWKEKFLQQIANEHTSEIIYENAKFKLIGFQFTNFTGKLVNRKNEFIEDMQSLMDFEFETV